MFFLQESAIKKKIYERINYYNTVITSHVEGVEHASHVYIYFIFFSSIQCQIFIYIYIMFILTRLTRIKMSLIL